MNNIIIVGSDERVIKSSKNIFSRFNMKDMGLAYVILQIQITRMPKDLILS